MRNIDYICASEHGIVEALLSAVASDGEGMAAALMDADFPQGALESAEGMAEWLDAERTVGAWEPNDSVPKIMADVRAVGHDIGVADYLDARGIGYDNETVDGLTHIALLDVSLRWAALYDTIGAALKASGTRMEGA